MMLQVTALNDCVLRTRGQCKFVALVDFDEFVAPKNNWNLIDFVEKSFAESANIGALKFIQQRLYYPLNPYGMYSAEVYYKT